jgi:hypothetical protein
MMGFGRSPQGLVVTRPYLVREQCRCNEVSIHWTTSCVLHAVISFSSNCRNRAYWYILRSRTKRGGHAEQFIMSSFYLVIVYVRRKTYCSSVCKARRDGVYFRPKRGGRLDLPPWQLVSPFAWVLDERQCCANGEVTVSQTSCHRCLV